MLKKIISILLILIIPMSFPLFALADAQPQVSAKSAVLINADSGEILYAKGENDKRPMASTTKIMTALITLEMAAVNNKIVTITDNMVRVEGSSMGLMPGNKLSLKSLAAGMLLVSGNDAANSAAIAIGGSTESFAELMNKRAKELNMTNTHFVTPSGLDDKEHYTTARDLAVLAAAAMKNPDFAEIACEKSMSVQFISPDLTRRLTNHNKLLSMYNGCVGVKTGFTKKAGRCLVSSAEKNGVHLVAVTLNASDDWNDHAKNNHYSLNILSNRYGEAQLPEVTVADMNLELEKGNDTILSSVLFNALNENLKSHRQSIVLLNRRGYNTFVSCKACGHVVTCPNCSISLTYHSANNRLMCHYCGYSVPFTKECPECHENKVYYSGCGTQRAEQQLQELLPEARILRLDTDSTMARFAYEKKLQLFSDGEYDIIIGTQMVAKGLDFENVTLVGVLSADQALYSDDFRSYERAFDLLTQVVGRSGRGKYTGRAIIQTFTPENNIIKLAAQQNYQEFYDGEIAIRKAMLYPPFSDICVIGFVGVVESKVHKASNAFLSMLSLLAQSDYSDQPMRVLNPSPALIGKISNKYRYKLIIKCRNNRRFREMISSLLIQFASNREFSNVTVFADINPDMIM